jgi:hypothetical protein
MSEDL